MSLRDELYQAVIDRPDRDGPRRRYAEYLDQQGDSFGEYIRVSLERARQGLLGQGLPAKLDDELAAPIRPWIRSWLVDRGFVAKVKMDGKAFVDHGSDVFSRAPIQHLDLVEAKPVFAEIMHSPVLARVQTLSLSSNQLDDNEASLLAASPHVRALLYLDLSGNEIGERGLDAITASPNLVALRVLEFDYNRVENPVSKWSSDGVSGLVHYEGAGPTQAVLKQKYGEKLWMHPPQNVDRLRMCDAGE
jgi:uncharacterized protein (TIGR02996 family)